MLSRVPISADMMDADIFRLRNTLFLWEQRRVMRFRRGLKLFMLCAAIFIFLISPVIFFFLERSSHPDLDFPTAMYWSGITALTIGYGDVVPVTTAGRALDLTNSVLGVTMTGVIAGLILGRVTSRSLP